MDAKTIFNLLKPQLESMEPKEKESLSNLIVGKNRSSKSHREILTVEEAKEKIKLYRSVEMLRENQANS